MNYLSPLYDGEPGYAWVTIEAGIYSERIARVRLTKYKKIALSLPVLESSN